MKSKDFKNWMVVLILCFSVMIVTAMIFQQVSLADKKTVDADSINNTMVKDSEYINYISEYLKGLEDTIQLNAKNLEGIKPNQVTTVEYLNNISSELNTLGQVMGEVDSSVADITQSSGEKTIEFVKKVSSHQKEIEDQIAATKELISEILTSIESEQIINTNTQEKLQTFETNLEHTKLQIETLVSQIDQLYEDMKILQISNHEQLLTSLHTVKVELLNNLKEYVLSLQFTQQDNYKHIISELDSLYNNVSKSRESISNTLSFMNNQSNNRQKEISTYFQSASDELEKVNQEFKESNENICTMINELISNLKDTGEENQTHLLEVLTDIYDNLSKISLKNTEQILSVLTDMQVELQDAKSNLLERINNLDQNSDRYTQDILSIINELQSEVGVAHEDIQSNIMTSRDTDEANFVNLYAFLSALETNLTKNSHQNNEQINMVIEELKTEIKSWFELSDTNFDERLSSIDIKLKESYNLLIDHISSGNTNIIEFLKSMESVISQDLQSVFTSVSSGKRFLASALLTKGVICKEDATFNEIYQAILNVPQQLLIGVEQIPGTIAYDYHYHTDHAGNQSHSSTHVNHGGCYNTPIYHTHSRSSCYVEVKFHTHNSSCPEQPVWVHWHPDYPEGYWGAEYICENMPLNDSRLDLTCSKSSSSVDYYKTDCGLNDGQIIAAHITY